MAFTACPQSGLVAFERLTWTTPFSDTVVVTVAVEALLNCPSSPFLVEIDTVVSVLVIVIDPFLLSTTLSPFENTVVT